MFLTMEKILLLVASSLVLCESALVDPSKKCSIKDDECMKNFFQSLIQTLGDNGAEDIGINRIDPMHLKEVHVSILGVMNITMVDGEVEGIKDCVIKNFVNDIEHGKATMLVFCKRITVHGQYSVELTGALLQLPGIGKNTRGEGNGKVIIDKAEIKLEFPFHFEKRNDLVHFKLEKGVKYNVNVIGKAAFEADNLIVGDKNASKNIIKYMNDNWRIVLQTFGTVFFDKTIEFVEVFTGQFFDSVPVKDFVNEDLSSYVK